GDGDAALAPGLGDDLRLALVLLRVQHVVRNSALLQKAGEHLALGDADGADEHWLPLLPALLDVVAHRLELLALGLVDGVLKILAYVKQAGWYDQHSQRLDLREL